MAQNGEKEMRDVFVIFLYLFIVKIAKLSGEPISIVNNSILMGVLLLVFRPKGVIK